MGHAITLYHQANCATDPAAKWDPATTSTSSCISTPFVANPVSSKTPTATEFGNVRKSTFLDKFYKTNFLYDGSFVGEQVNNTLKHLPNDKIRAPYVWTVYNPVEFTGVKGKETSPNAALGFVYPSKSVPNFDGAVDVSNTGNKIDNWWKCHSEINTAHCAKYSFSGPSPATDDPMYRFPIFADKNELNGAFQNSGVAAQKYLACSLWSVCIFIRIQSPIGGQKNMRINYHYKPANYLRKEGKSAPTADVANLEDYDIVYGAEMRGT